MSAYLFLFFLINFYPDGGFEATTSEAAVVVFRDRLRNVFS
jgi:multisubunit Na+/H+ antiporter MnhB subunit